MEKLTTSCIKTFTTQPKNHARKGHSPIRDRCLEFIKILNEYGYKDEIPLEEAKKLFFLTLGIGDKLSLNKYFGTQQSRSTRKIQRMARYGTGRLSFKSIELSQEIPEKKGYFELLGLARYEQRGNTVFMILKNGSIIPEILAKGAPQHYESSKLSIDKIYLSSYSPREEVLGETVSEVSPKENKTNNNIQSEKYKLSLENVYKNVYVVTNGLTEEETAILHAKPLDSEPDRGKIGKIKWGTKPFKPKFEPKLCVNCGLIDSSNPYRILCPNGKGLRNRNEACIMEGDAHG